MKVETIQQKKILDYIIEKEYFNLNMFEIELVADDKLKFIDRTGDYIIFQLIGEEVKEIDSRVD